MRRRLPPGVDIRDLEQAAHEALLRNPKASVVGAMQDYLRQIDPLSRGERKRVRAGEASFSLLDVDFESMAGDEPGPEKICEYRQMASAMRSAINKLPERERYVIHEIYFQERRGIDVASDLGVSGAMVTHLMRQAEQRLARTMWAWA